MQFHFRDKQILVEMIVETYFGRRIIGCVSRHRFLSHETSLHLERVAVPMCQHSAGLHFDCGHPIMLKRIAPSAGKRALASAMSAAVQERLGEKCVGMYGLRPWCGYSRACAFFLPVTCMLSSCAVAGAGRGRAHTSRSHVLGRAWCKSA